MNRNATIVPLFLILQSLFLMNTKAVYAQGAVVEKIGLVNMQRVIDESILGKAAERDLELEAKKSQLAVESEKRELLKMKDDLKKQVGLLSDAAIEEKRELMRKKERDLARRVQDEKESFARKKSEKIKHIVEEIDNVVKEIHEQGGYGFILDYDSTSVLYGKESLDISNEIIEKLNTKHVGI